MSGRHSFSELTRDFTQERRRRIAEMRAELPAGPQQPALRRKHMESCDEDPDMSRRFHRS